MSEILKLCQMFGKTRKKITTFELVVANSGIRKKTQASADFTLEILQLLIFKYFG